ncbi:MAG: hypothetical protein AAGG38_12385 [Planctomycetota bacterium]
MDAVARYLVRRRQQTPRPPHPTSPLFVTHPTTRNACSRRLDPNDLAQVFRKLNRGFSKHLHLPRQLLRVGTSRLVPQVLFGTLADTLLPIVRPGSYRLVQGSH